MALRVCDISNRECGIDIKRLLKGCDGLIIKATEGTKFTDISFTPWAKAINKTDKVFGFYHFFKGEGVAEAKHFYQQTKAYFGEGIPIINVQVYASPEEVEKFVKWIYAKTGVWCWIYTAAAFVGTYLNDFTKEHCKVWCSGYPSTPTKWTKQAFPYSDYAEGCEVIGWQFTNCLTIANKAVNASVFYTDSEGWNSCVIGDDAKPVEEATDVDIAEQSVLYLTLQSLKGAYGDLDERKLILGKRNDEVQKFLNHISRCSTKTLAKELVQGCYGDEDDAKLLLGNRYSVVRAQADNL